MEIFCERKVKKTIFGKRYATLVRISLTEDEKKSVHKGKLWSYQVRNTAMITSIKFKVMFERIKNRWNFAVSRTSGFVLLDVIWLVFRAIGFVIWFAFRLVFGRRRKLKHLLSGVEYRANSIEALKEQETIIFASLSGVVRAIDYIEHFDEQVHVVDRNLAGFVPGLDFASGAAVAGTQFPQGSGNLFSDGNIISAAAASEDEMEIEDVEVDVEVPDLP